MKTSSNPGNCLPRYHYSSCGSSQKPSWIPTAFGYCPFLWPAIHRPTPKPHSPLPFCACCLPREYDVPPNKARKVLPRGSQEESAPPPLSLHASHWQDHMGSLHMKIVINRATQSWDPFKTVFPATHSTHPIYQRVSCFKYCSKYWKREAESKVYYIWAMDRRSSLTSSLPKMPVPCWMEWQGLSSIWKSP